MDYPKSVPNVGLVDGKFVDEDTTNGIVGSLIPAEWGNSVTQEILNVIQGAGLTPDEADVTQLRQAVATYLQSQTYSAFNTASVSPALTLTPVPAAKSYSTNLRFSVKFSAASTGADTLNISGLGAKQLKQYDQFGNKVPATFGNGQISNIQYDGVDLIVLDPLPSVAGTQGTYSNLKMTTAGTNAIVVLTADEFNVRNAAGVGKRLTAVNLQVNGANSGVANGLDTGALTANTWYYLHVIYNPTTNTVAGLLSLSATAPTLPSGYTYSAYAATVRVGATATRFYPSLRRNGRTDWTPTASTDMPSDFPFLLNAGTSTSFTAVSMSSFMPPTAKAGYIGANYSGTTSGSASITRGPSGAPSGIIGLMNSNGTTTIRVQFSVPDPFSLPIYYGIASSGACTIVAQGWEE